MSVKHIDTYLSNDYRDKYIKFLSQLKAGTKSFQRRVKSVLGTRDKLVDGYSIWEREFSIPGKHGRQDVWVWQLLVDDDGPSLWIVDKRKLPEGPVLRAAPAALDDLINLWNLSLQEKENKPKKRASKKTRNKK